MKVHIVVDWEGGSVIGAFENLKDAHDTKKAHQFPRFLSVETVQTIPSSELNSILSELEMLKRAVEFFPVEYNLNGVRKCFDKVEEIEAEIQRVKEEYE